MTAVQGSKARIARALELLAALGEPARSLGPIAAAAGGLDDDDDGAKAAEIEDAIRRVDAARPAATFQGRFRRDIPPAAQVAYARVLASGEPSAGQIDRVEFLLTRLLTRELDEGLLEVLPEADFVRTLAQVVPDRAIDDDPRAKAVGFFTDAAERLRALSGVQDLFESGLLVDVRAYRESLGEARLDPAVLYASVLFEIGLTNHLVRLAGSPQDDEAASATSDGDLVDEKASGADDDVRPLPPEAQVRRALEGAIAALEVYRSLGAQSEEVPVLAAEADAAAARLSRSYDAEGARRAHAVVAAVLELDDGLEPLWLESMLGGKAASVEARTRYAAFLTAHPGPLARQRRIEHVVTTLLTRRAATGGLEVLPEPECVRVLARVSPRPLADEAHRSAAAGCFLDTARKLATFERIEDLFDSGVYLNLLGYRRALGWTGLDPGLLYAQTLLHAALTNHLLRFWKDDGAPMERIRARAAEEERRVAEIFRETETLDDAAEPTFDQLLDATLRRLRDLDGSVDMGGGMRSHSEAEVRALRKRALRTAAAVLALVLSSIPLGLLAFRDENTLHDLGDARLRQLAPWLETGALSSGTSPKVFLGQVDDAAWRVMTPAEREREASRLAASLKEIEVRGALVQRGQRLAIQIDGGRVVFVR